MKKTSQILDSVLEKIKPSNEETQEIKNSLNQVLKLISKRLKILKVDAEIFVGGSYAKNTMIKKDNYDIDIFIRYDKKYKADFSSLTKKILKGIQNVSVVHGSRDYFRIKINQNLYLELVPVLKVKNPKEADNITDLSYSHVKYINRKVKKNLLDDIMLAKAFCYANNCYGAESYIHGFSGYSLELLIYHYGGFMKFVKAMSKINVDKHVIDIEKYYKNKNAVLMDVNSSKLNSPIILIDPTYKERNTLAALSNETFKKFQKECKRFLKNPNLKSFELKKTDLEKIKTNAKKKKFEFVLLQSKTLKQSGDVAGSKLLKFYNHLSFEIEKYFKISNKGFNYNKEQSARYFFVVKPKPEIVFGGPSIKDKKNATAFRKKHKNYFEKKSRLYAKEKFNVNVKKFLEVWQNKNKKQIKEMYISGLEVI